MYPKEKQKSERMTFNLPNKNMEKKTMKNEMRLLDTGETKNYGVEAEDPFEEPEPSLTLIDGYVNGFKAGILLDSGATIKHISKSFFVEWNYHTKRKWLAYCNGK